MAQRKRVGLLIQRLWVRVPSGVTLFLFFLLNISSSIFYVIFIHTQTDIEIEGGSSGISVNTNNLPRIPSGVTPEADQGYHLCSCEDGRLFLVNTNSQGCFAAVGHSQLGNICS